MENTLADIIIPDSDFGKKLRPKYGTIIPHDPAKYRLWTDDLYDNSSKAQVRANGSGRYGDLIAVFRESVKYRTSYTPRDSLVRWSQRAKSLECRNCKSRFDKYDGEYLEAQIWGEIDLSDVAYFMVSSKTTQEDFDFLRRLGLPIYKYKVVLQGKYLNRVRKKILYEGDPAEMKNHDRIARLRENAASSQLREERIVPLSDRALKLVRDSPEQKFKQYSVLDSNRFGRATDEQVYEAFIQGGVLIDLSAEDAKSLLELLRLTDPRMVESVGVQFLRTPELLKNRELLSRFMEVSQGQPYHSEQGISFYSSPLYALTSSSVFLTSPYALDLLLEKASFFSVRVWIDHFLQSPFLWKDPKSRSIILKRAAQSETLRDQIRRSIVTRFERDPEKNSFFKSLGRDLSEKSIDSCATLLVSESLF